MTKKRFFEVLTRLFSVADFLVTLAFYAIFIIGMGVIVFTPIVTGEEVEVTNKMLLVLIVSAIIIFGRKDKDEEKPAEETHIYLGIHRKESCEECECEKEKEKEEVKEEVEGEPEPTPEPVTKEVAEEKAV